MLDLIETIQTLAEACPIFHSEADFQHALAWQLHTDCPEAKIRLEYPLKSAPMPDRSDKRLEIDIVAHPPEGTTAIELKYVTDEFHTSHNGEQFKLKRHAADNRRSL